MNKNKTNLKSENPELAKEWHLIKNHNLTPHDVTPGSDKKVWWICDKGHEWQAHIYKRTKGHGCPYCSGHRVCEDNCLANINSTLSKEWHPTKNGILTPNDFTTGSGKKVWWKCKKGHEWQAAISDRNSGKGCPFCSGHKVSKDNCLETVNSTLAKEWHPIKNGNIKPINVSANSHKKAWWICLRGHEWQAQIKSRNRGTDCPYCSGNMVCEDNCLATIDTKLAKEWHPTKNGALTPHNVTHGSGRIVWWKCNKGHEWKQAVNQRKKVKICPYCSCERLSIDSCLFTLNPELVKEWHPIRNNKLTPKDVFPNSNKKAWWKCKKGHEWEAVIASRNSGVGCPYCAGQKVCEDNCLATLNPSLAKEWHPSKNKNITPKDVTIGSSRNNFWWKCNRGHEWRATVANRVIGTRCPICNPQTSQLELRVYTEIKMLFKNTKHRIKKEGLEIDIFIPSLQIGIEVDGYFWHKDRYKDDILKNETLKKKNILLFRIREKGLKKITDNDIFVSRRGLNISSLHNLAKSIIKNISNEPAKRKLESYLKCNSYINDKEFNELLYRLPSPISEKSLLSVNPELAKEWHDEKNIGLTPDDVYPGSEIKAWWKCKYGHEWQAFIYSRNSGSGCPYCAGQKVSIEKSLASANPTLSKEWHPSKNSDLTPYNVMPGSNKKAWWLCKNGHEWQANIYSRNRGNSCPYCAGKKAFKDNCLSTINPSLSKEWHPIKNCNLNPVDVTPGSSKKVWWLCEKGHEWKAAICDRNSGKGCPYCSNRKVCKDNCLSTVNPSIAKEWHPIKNGRLTPKDVVVGSHKEVWWQCKNGHEWKTKVYLRNNNSICPMCK